MGDLRHRVIKVFQQFLAVKNSPLQQIIDGGDSEGTGEYMGEILLI